jgi:phage replication O-like protein O
LADVQPEHGWTKLADELLEALCRAQLSGRPLAVMLAMVRLTYGWGRVADRISSTQIAKLCDLDAGNVRTVLGQLVDARMLEHSGGAYRTNVWWIQKDHERWVVARRRRRGADSPRVVDNARTSVVDNARSRVVDNAHHRQRDRKTSESAEAGALLVLIKNLGGTPEERELWLRHELPVIEAEADGNAKLRRVLACRYFRAYLRGPREHRTELARQARLEREAAEREQLRREEASLTPEQKRAAADRLGELLGGIEDRMRMPARHAGHGGR